LAAVAGGVVWSGFEDESRGLAGPDPASTALPDEGWNGSLRLGSNGSMRQGPDGSTRLGSNGLTRLEPNGWTRPGPHGAGSVVMRGPIYRPVADWPAPTAQAVVSLVAASLAEQELCAPAEPESLASAELAAARVVAV
jgi:hypothetical protein